MALASSEATPAMPLTYFAGCARRFRKATSSTSGSLTESTLNVNQRGFASTARTTLPRAPGNSTVSRPCRNEHARDRYSRPAFFSVTR